MENLIKNRMNMDSEHFSGSSDLEKERENLEWIKSVYSTNEKKIKFK